MTDQYLKDELVRRGYGIAVRNWRDKKYFAISYAPSDFPLNYWGHGVISHPNGTTTR